jgi:prophage DNA circulation protein
MPDLLRETLQNAAYEGVEFPVSEAGIQGGNGGVEHRAYRRPGADVEFTGQEPYRGKLVIPLFVDLGADLYPDRYNRLLDAFRRKPIGELRHPLLGTFQALIKTWQPHLDAGARSGVVLEVEWVEHNATATAPVSLRETQRTDAQTTAEAQATEADAAMYASDPTDSFTPTQPVVSEQLATLENTSPAPSYAQVTSAIRTMLAAVEGNLALPAFEGVDAHDVVAALEALRNTIYRLRAQLLPDESRMRTHVLERDLALWQVALLVYGDASQGARLAAVNALPDPSRIPAGTVLQVPPLEQ